jgi:hypothetical protein
MGVITRELANDLTSSPNSPYQLGQVVGFDFDHQPPMLLVNDVERPMRFLGNLVDYTYFDSVVYVARNGGPLVIGRLPYMGGDLEDWHLVGAGGEPAFQNSWANFGGAHAVAGFYMQPDGWVRLKGLVASGTSTSTIFTLPEGYRPPFNAVFTSVSNGVQCVIQVDTSGNVSKPIGGSNAHASLAGVTFPTLWNRAQWLLPVLEQAWSRSAQPNPTVEMFRRDDGWVWTKGILTGTLNTRILVLPEQTRVLSNHILACVDIPAFAFNRVDLFYKGVMTHVVGATNVNLGGKNWFTSSGGRTFVAPTFLNSWANFATDTENAGYYVDHLGVCHLQGVVTGTNNDPIFNLPAGVRPLEQHIFFTVSAGEVVCRVDVLANGDVKRGLPVANGYLSLNGVSFRVEQ